MMQMRTLLLQEPCRLTDEIILGFRATLLSWL